MAYKIDSAFYIGREDEKHLTEFFVSDNLYLILELKNGHNRTQVSEILKRFKNEIVFKTDITLDELKLIVGNTFDSISNKENYSLAIILLVGNISYLLTRGDGEIYLYRQDKYNKIIHGNIEASGYCKLDDMFLLSSKTFSSIVNESVLENALILKDPKNIVGEIAPNLKEKEDVGAIALLIYLKEEVEEEVVGFEEIDKGEGVVPEFPPEKKENLLDKFNDKFDYYQKNFSHNKKLTFLLLLVVVIMFVWSVGFGSLRRANEQLTNTINTDKQKIDAKLNEAKEIGILNPDSATSLISDAKNIFEDLKKTVGNKNPEELNTISINITSAEKSIFKQEDKNFQEFYDLNLIKKGIKAIGTSIDKEQAVFINKDLGEAYYLNIATKSFTTIKKEEIKKMSFFSSYNNNLFIYLVDDGIYKIDTEGKVGLVIKKDADWGMIGGMLVFNGNIYLLDKGKDNIYKYLVAENGYSDKNIYFKPGQEVNLSDFIDYSIDANIYILTSDGVFKYLSGLRDDFSYNIPESSGKYQKIYADKDNENVYLLEKGKSKVYILSKKGQYDKQISSAIFSKAEDLFVNESMKSIFVLVGDKIYQVGL